MRHNMCEVLVADAGCDDHGLPDAARPPESEFLLMSAKKIDISVRFGYSYK